MNLNMNEIKKGVYNTNMTVIEETIKVTNCVCCRCGYIWVPKNKDNLPSTCASRKCKSPYWNKPRRQNKEIIKHLD